MRLKGDKAGVKLGCIRRFHGYSRRPASLMTTPKPHPCEQERLALLRKCGILDTAPEFSFDGLVQLAASIAGVPIALVTLIDSERQWFKAHHGLEVTQTPRAVAFCAHCILNSTEALVVEDARKDPRFQGNPLVEQFPKVIFYAGIPLHVGPNQLPLGTLCVIDHQPRTLSPLVLSHLKILARQVEELLESRLRQRQLEDALVGQAQANAKSLLLTKIAAQVPGMVYQYVLMPDGTSRFPYSSAGILSVCGFSPEDVEKSALPVIERLYAADRERVLTSIAISAESLTLWACEYRYQHPDGRLLWLQGNALPE